MEIQGLGMSTTVLANANTQSSVGMAMLNKALDADKANGDTLASMLERSVNPLVGQNIDIRI
ncbi:MAG: YjfB family protein [Lachnospiraceae bacterium]|nr:YjfB family protein [Lachnospiraceae bacterium]MDE6626303.1 YjfB family protein [Lachnospiraceae bacterium]